MGAHVVCLYRMEDFGGEIESDLARSVNRFHDGILVEEMGGGLSLARS